MISKGWVCHGFTPDFLVPGWLLPCLVFLFAPLRYSLSLFNLPCSISPVPVGGIGCFKPVAWWLALEPDLCPDFCLSLAPLWFCIGLLLIKKSVDFGLWTQHFISIGGFWVLKQHWIKIIGSWILWDFLTSLVNKLVQVGVRISDLCTVRAQSHVQVCVLPVLTGAFLWYLSKFKQNLNKNITNVC